jgi:hypothetical protein
VWNFGDQSSQTLTTATNVKHTYYTSQASHNFTVTLTVIDDQGLTNSYSRTVTIKNYQPVAGFDVELPSAGTNWTVSDLNVYNLGIAVQTVSVTFRSINPTTNGTDWVNGATTPNESTSNAPGNFEENGSYSDGDKNLSYDIEGHNTGSGWGITTYLWNYGDGQTATIAAHASGGCADGGDTTAGHVHHYQWDGTQNSVSYNVILEVVDAQGARRTITRQITLYKDPE